MEKKYILGNNVSETLLIPLCSRVKATKRYPNYFNFTSSVKIIDKIDLKEINFKMNNFTDLCTGLRQLQAIQEAKEFLVKHPKATIVNIGCGLDDLFSYLDNKQMKFYNLDLEKVIKLREELLETHEREFNISKSFLDFSFANDIEYKEENGIIFLMMGIVYYFEPDEIKSFIEFIPEKYKNGKLIFDSCSIMGIKKNNEKINEMGISGAEMKFLIKNPKIFKTWSKNIKNFSLNYYWDSCLKDKKDIELKYRLLLKVMGFFKSAYIVKIEF